MAEALKTFREGEDILASETNENNQFLLSKLSDNAAQVQSYVEGEVATIKSNVASAQATLQNNIDELDAKVNEKIVVVETYRDGNKWYRIWSDGWCEQGFVSPSKNWGYGANVDLIKAYPDTDYTVVVNKNGDGYIQSVTKYKNYINIDAAGGAGTASVYACGYIK